MPPFRCIQQRMEQPTTDRCKPLRLDINGEFFTTAIRQQASAGVIEDLQRQNSYALAARPQLYTVWHASRMPGEGIYCV
jgi:hypothetical protein